MKRVRRLRSALARVEFRGGVARARQRGQVLAMVALGLIALIGAVGLAVDGSRLLEERRNAQAAVDHAALTAARASCTGALQADAELAGRTAAAANTFPHAPPNIEVTVTKEANPPHTFRAEIHSVISTTFASVIGISSFDVTVEASAGGLGCNTTPSGGGRAMFAGGDSCNGPSSTSSVRNIKISGNDHRIEGGSHTNGGVEHSGTRTAMLGTPNALTYRWPDGSGDGRSMFSGSDNTYSGPKLQVTTASEAWPTGYGPLDQTTAMWDAYKAAAAARGQTNFMETVWNNVTTDGVWYTEASSIDVKDIRDGWIGVIVSRNAPITLGIDLRGGIFSAPATPPAGTPQDIVMVSGFGNPSQPCDQFAISRSGNTGTWQGIWWAPKAQIRIAGERTTVTKGLISHGIQLEGNWHVISNTGASTGGSGTIVTIE